MNWVLPLFIRPQTKIFWGIIWTVFSAALYMVTNHVHLFEPQYLPLSWVDQNVPFIPETVWIYTSEYYLFFSVYYFCKDSRTMHKYLYSFLALQIVSAIIFMVWPTTFHRELFPLPAGLDHWSRAIFESVRASDSPASCAPSLHVSSCYLASFVFLDEQKRKFPFYFLWATAVGVSTLTTKQHYLIDVVLGFAIAALMYWIFHKCVDYKPLQPKR